MNVVLLQYWEESERGWGVRPDGASIHFSTIDHRFYLNEIYNSRDSKNIPDEYDRVVGGPIKAMVNNSLFNEVMEKKSLRISQYQLNNLMKLNDIVVC